MPSLVYIRFRVGQMQYVLIIINKDIINVLLLSRYLGMKWKPLSQMTTKTMVGLVKCSSCIAPFAILTNIANK